jgi:hypothetical protein
MSQFEGSVLMELGISNIKRILESAPPAGA